MRQSAINHVIASLTHQLAVFEELSAYDEADHVGTLRYLQLSVERSSSLVQVAAAMSLGTSAGILRTRGGDERSQPSPERGKMVDVVATIAATPDSSIIIARGGVGGV